MDDKIKKLREVVAVQVSNGNWDYSEYMMGLANGLLCALAIVEEKEPLYKNSPEKWLCDLD